MPCTRECTLYLHFLSFIFAFCCYKMLPLSVLFMPNEHFNELFRKIIETREESSNKPHKVEVTCILMISSSSHYINLTLASFPLVLIRIQLKLFTELTRGWRFFPICCTCSHSMVFFPVCRYHPKANLKWTTKRARISKLNPNWNYFGTNYSDLLSSQLEYFGGRKYHNRMVECARNFHPPFLTAACCESSFPLFEFILIVTRETRMWKKITHTAKRETMRRIFVMKHNRDGGYIKGNMYHVSFFSQYNVIHSFYDPCTEWCVKLFNKYFREILY